MFNTVFIEENIKLEKNVQDLLSKIKFKDKKYINKVEDVWGRVKKPYLQKRETLNLFIGHKKGQLVKVAPAAYGLGKEKHYYFIHAYNCIYECQYCYLQGYFNTPDIVLFVNHTDIIKEMEEIVSIPGQEDSWFHAGEYSDSLSLTHITGELEVYFDFFKRYPKAKLELRTKAVNTKALLNLDPLPNIFVSFTMSSTVAGETFDYKCPSVRARLMAIEKVARAGFQIGIHFDPIIYHDNFLQGYNDIIQKLIKIIPESQFGYLSIGVVRFTKDVYKEVQKNYPDSFIHKQDYIKSFDNKIRYSKPMRMWIMNSVKEACITSGISSKKIYLCMEED